MKAMKKVFAILLVVAMVMGLSVTAFAADTAVAEVNGTTYTDIAEAIDTAGKVEGGGTVKLLADVSDVTINAGTTVTIDLNGYTISSVKDHAITNNGTLTVTGTGTVDGGSTSGKGALYNSPTGIATLNGGTFTGSKWYVIKNLGTMTISGASVVQNDIKSSTIASGYWGSGSANDCYVQYPTNASTTVSLTITGGTVTGGINCVKNDDYGTLTISGGYFYTTASDGATIMNWNNATISDGTFVGDGTAAVISNGYWTENAGVGTLTISGGDFTATNNGNLFGTGASVSGATTTITGGTFVGTANNVTVGGTSVITTTVSGNTAVFSDDTLPDEWTTTDYVAPTTATIIVHGVTGQTYTAYKIFDVTISGDAYSYSISASDTTWLPVVQNYITQKDSEGNTIDKGLTLTLSGDGSKYVVEYVDGTFSAADFAAYLLANISGKTGTTGTANSDGTATISGLAPGYYLVDSSLGALMILDTADVATVNEKNAEPSLTKEVLEDSTNTYGSTATADMQQEVSFKLTVNVGSISTGIDKDYVITDTLPTGMSYVTNSLFISGWTADTDYSVSQNGGVLTITLNQSKLATLATDSSIEITYKATVDADAVIGYPEGNTNTASLTYGTYKTVEVQATVYTYEIGEGADGKATIVKVDGSTLGENGEVLDSTTKLAGVKFVLSKTETENSEDVTYYAVLNAVYDEEEIDKIIGYQLAGWSKTLDDVTNGGVTDPGATRIETNAEGTFVVYGLDADTYILTETETLDGYNLLNDTITVEIAEDGKVTYKYTSATGDPEGSITIVNNSGTELPSTGGIGTTIFYVVGSILVIGAAVLLITKKRMNGAAE